MASEELLETLRAAVRAAPDNSDLRLTFAKTLLHEGHMDEADAVLREGVNRAPRSAPLQRALAEVFRRTGRFSAAHVILDALIQDERDGALARVERARTLLDEGLAAEAAREYRMAVDDDPDVGDPELAGRLGLRDLPGDDSDDDDLVFDPRLRLGGDPGAEGPNLQPMQSDIDFASVGGMEDLKHDIRRKIIQPLQHPELYAAYGKKVGGGILLYGPPGCGKTHLARATAGEIKASFLTVGIHEILDMWVGRSERNLHEVFEVARRHKPCVLFFDEADALGASRGDMRHSAGRQTINQFLDELDGVRRNNDGVLILAATNAPWQMDPAFRRPGRFDRVVFVPPPDLAARGEVLRIHLRGKPQDGIDFRAVAKKTEGFSGADLQAVVETAIEQCLDDAIKLGKPRPLTTRDLLQAAKTRRPTTGEWFRTVRNHVLYANEDGLYDDIKPFLKL